MAIDNQTPTTTVWLARLSDISQACYDKSYALLGSEERQRLQRIQSEKKQAEYLSSRALLRHALSQIFKQAPEFWQFEQPPNHPPTLRNRGYTATISLSHTTELVGVAIDSKPLGLDIESNRINRNLDAITRRVFTPEQSALIVAAAPAQKQAHFLALWTRKEALYKAHTINQTPFEFFSTQAIIEPPFQLSYALAANHLIALAYQPGDADIIWRSCIPFEADKHNPIEMDTHHRPQIFDLL